MFSSLACAIAPNVKPLTAAEETSAFEELLPGSVVPNWNEGGFAPLVPGVETAGEALTLFTLWPSAFVDTTPPNAKEGFTGPVSLGCSTFFSFFLGVGLVLRSRRIRSSMSLSRPIARAEETTIPPSMAAPAGSMLAPTTPPLRYGWPVLLRAMRPPRFCRCRG